MNHEHELELLKKIESGVELIRLINDNCPNTEAYSHDYTPQQMWKTLRMISDKCAEFLKDEK